MKAKIRFFYDIVCPYAYLASTQIHQLLPYAEIQWVPILLGGIFKQLQAPQVPAQHMSPAKQLMNQVELYRWAKQWQIPFSFSEHHPQRTVETMRFLCAIEDQNLLQQATKLLYAYYWQKQEKLSTALLDQISIELGLDQGLWARESSKQRLIDQTQEAYALGVFGVPSFVIDQEIFWGQDRLNLLIEYIKKTQPKPQNTLRFYHDFSSPFSFLASTQIQSFAKSHDVEVEYFPILLGALFKEINTPIVPLLSMNASKQQYILKDLKRWADHWDVPLTIPSFFPLKSTNLLRISMIEPRLIDHIYHAIWVENRAIHQEEELFLFLDEYAEKYDYQSQKLYQTAMSDQYKEKLRQNTSFAVENQVFGVPTIEVLGLNQAQKQYQDEIRQSSQLDEKSMLFWGQDRFDQLSAFLKLRSTKKE